jgi:hypothetical protein
MIHRVNIKDVHTSVNMKVTVTINSQEIAELYSKAERVSANVYVVQTFQTLILVQTVV